MTRKRTPQPPAPSNERFEEFVRRRISIATAAERGCVCERTVRRWIADKLFLASRPVASGSGRVLIDEQDFERFLSGAA